MELMEYVNFFESKIKRKIQLVNLLTEKELSVNKLTTYIPKTAKTIKVDIDELKIDLEYLHLDDVKLLRNNNKYKLVGLDEKTQHVLILYYIESSVELQMYMFLLDPKKKLSLFLKSLYMTHSQFRTRYPEFEKFFSSYGFQLLSISKHLCGDEINIRFFFLQFFWELFRGTTWPFKDVSENMIEERILGIQRVSGQLLSVYEKKKLAYFLAICEIRKKNNSQIAIPKIVKQVLESPLYDSVQTVCVTLTKSKEPINGAEITLFFMLYLFPVLNCSISDKMDQVKDILFSTNKVLCQNEFAIKEWIETMLPTSNRNFFYVCLLQLVLVEKIFPFLLLKDEVKKFYLCFIGKNDWAYEDKKISEDNGKDFDVCNWVLSHMLTKQAKVHISSMYGERVEAMIRSQVFLGWEHQIDWIASEQEIDDQTLVITDYLFSFEGFEKKCYVTFPLTNKKIFECQELYRKLLELPRD